MIYHIDLGNSPFGIKRKLQKLIKEGSVVFGGNKNLKIYGLLNCRSGKRIKITNRVFFSSEVEAFEKGYRPCGHCMKDKYLEWQRNIKS